ncbi:MAG: hypothetical protein Q7K38_02865 [Candidatus Wildermuthbacteria bacterium]|nr:hypothetical protein [Candidatus Wildermuthbacteria bacterium]
MPLLHLGGDHTSALAAVHKAAKRFRVAVVFLRMPALGHNFLHFIEKPLFDYRRMPSLVHLAAVFKKADIERVGENKLHSVFVRLIVEMAFYSIRFHKY